MELIQNSVLNREGKKWKQRWAILRKVSPKYSPDEESLYYLFLYKDASHARINKEKHVLPLLNFCGLSVCDHYEKASNILILITSSQSTYLSFNLTEVRNQWNNILVKRFGRAKCFNISIPDKQRLKPGKATIRLYPTFFSLVTNKHFRCLNRWFLNDVYRYTAFDNSHFVFEITGPSRSKGTVITLLVENNAYEISKAFDHNKGESIMEEVGMSQADFHGSAILDELDQAKRISGEQSFFHRVILRASNRMKRKKRTKSHCSSSKDKQPQSPGVESLSDETKYRSLDRRRNQSLNVSLDDNSMMKTMQLKRFMSHPGNMEDAPPLPDKKLSSENIKPRSLTENDVATATTPVLMKKSSTSKSLDTVTEREVTEEEKNDIAESTKVLEKIETMVKPTDKIDLHEPQSRRSVDSLTTRHPSKSSFKSKKSKGRSEQLQMPTPPPRSPVSLGLEPPTVFEFPSTENLAESEPKSSVDWSEVDGPTVENRRKSFDSEQLSDDAFVKTELHNPNSEPSDTENNNLVLNRLRVNGCRSSKKHLSDPLVADAWAASREQKVNNLHNIHKVEYVNVKGKVPFERHLAPVNGVYYSDDDNDSYVNVSLNAQQKAKKNKPEPLHINFKNHFEKYDDDDGTIYHPVDRLKGEQQTHSSENLSYENLQLSKAALGKHSEYLNLMSPSNKKQPAGLNYVMVTGKGPYNFTTKSTSPVRRVSKFPVDVPDKSDYTRIDEDMTGALNRSMYEHRQQRVSSVPTTK